MRFSHHFGGMHTITSSANYNRKPLKYARGLISPFAFTCLSHILIRVKVRNSYFVGLCRLPVSINRSRMDLTPECPKLMQHTPNTCNTSNKCANRSHTPTLITPKMLCPNKPRMHRKWSAPCKSPTTQTTRYVPRASDQACLSRRRRACPARIAWSSCNRLTSSSTRTHRTNSSFCTKNKCASSDSKCISSNTSKCDA